MGPTDRKSYSDNMLYLNGDCVACFTHKQPVVAASSIGDECIAMLDAYKDGLGLHYFLGELVQVYLTMHKYLIFHHLNCMFAIYRK